MSIIERINNQMLKVDLHTQLTKSVRDTFLYTGLARERSGEMNFKLQAKVRWRVLISTIFITKFYKFFLFSLNHQVTNY